MINRMTASTDQTLQVLPMDIPGILSALRQSFNNGKSRPQNFRREQLNGIARFLKECEQEIYQALHDDLHKSKHETYISEISVTNTEVDFALKNLSSWMNPTNVSTLFAAKPGHAHIKPEPLGVILIIAPWNYPLQLSLVPLIGVIAAGNCAVLKPSELAPATSKLLADKLPQFLDKACFQVIEGGIPETTQLLAEHFDHILFTGSGNVGKIVMEAAAKHLTPVTLELGGKSPCIVDRNTDLDTTAERILWGKFTNAGQTCIAPDYVLVHEDVEQELLECMKRKLRDFYGYDPKLSPDYGRIINLRHYSRLMELIKNSGEIVVGGDGIEGERYISPTILKNVPLSAPVMDDSMEIFGPILPVLKVKSIEEAVQFVNQRPKPLTLYLFSHNPATQQYVEENTSAGGMVINHTLMHEAMPTLPFGGVGASGMGAYHGKQSFDTFSHKKPVLVKPNSSWVDPSKLLYPPASETKESLIKMVL